MNQPQVLEPSVKTTSQGRSISSPFDNLILWVAGHFGSKAKEVERFLKFAIVGVIGAVVDFSTLFILQATILKPAPPAEVGKVVAATTLAFLAAVTSNFLFNRFWTYPDSRSRSVRRQMAQFTLINLVGWSGRTLWIANTYAWFGVVIMPFFMQFMTRFRPTYAPEAHLQDKLGTFAAQLIALGIVMIWNFFANRYWTYNDVD